MCCRTLKANWTDAVLASAETVPYRETAENTDMMTTANDITAFSYRRTLMLGSILLRLPSVKWHRFIRAYATVLSELSLQSRLIS